MEKIRNTQREKIAVSTSQDPTKAQTNFASTTLDPKHIENWTNFSEQYNDLGLNVHLEAYSVKQELIRQAQRNYKEHDAKKMHERVQDLETTLDINKGLINTLVAN